MDITILKSLLIGILCIFIIMWIAKDCDRKSHFQ